MAYVGTPIDTQNQFQSLQGKRFSGNASTTAFTLDIAPNSVFDIEVFVENVRQDPNSAYTLNGTTLTFSAAPPSGTNNIYVIHQAKAVGTITAPVGGSIDMNGVELILDEDGDTSITADTDDQIDFKTGGTDRVVIASDGDVGIGETSPAKRLHIKDTGSSNAKHVVLRVENADTGDSSTGLEFITNRGSTAGSTKIYGAPEDGSGTASLQFIGANHFFRNQADSSNYLAINSDGKTLVGGQDSFTTSNLQVRRGGEPPLTLDRSDNDGKLVQFHQATTEEGNISVSGSTVSYNGFTGTHWSRLSDGSKPTILRGTILESLDEMCDWYAVEFETHDGIITQPYSLESNSVGDTLTYNFNGKDYTAKIIKENDVKHAKCKISDTEASKAVYGLFVSWDEDEDTVNDMLVAQTGTYVIRIHKDETVSKGDLIQSNGDGTGKVQADDIIRASTVAKVLSTTKIETYSDGSYIVPCSLHC